MKDIIVDPATKFSFNPAGFFTSRTARFVSVFRLLLLQPSPAAVSNGSRGWRVMGSLFPTFSATLR